MSTEVQTPTQGRQFVRLSALSVAECDPGQTKGRANRAINYWEVVRADSWDRISYCFPASYLGAGRDSQLIFRTVLSWGQGHFVFASYPSGVFRERLSGPVLAVLL